MNIISGDFDAARKQLLFSKLAATMASGPP
jgi:hypothetical protein